MIINGDLQDSEEQVIACYLVGLKFNILRVIYLQPYNTLQCVMKLALKVEGLNKYRSLTTTRSATREEFTKDSTSMNLSHPKTTPFSMHEPQ